VQCKRGGEPMAALQSASPRTSWSLGPGSDPRRARPTQNQPFRSDPPSINTAASAERTSRRRALPSPDRGARVGHRPRVFGHEGRNTARTIFRATRADQSVATQTDSTDDPNGDGDVGHALHGRVDGLHPRHGERQRRSDQQPGSSGQPTIPGSRQIGQTLTAARGDKGNTHEDQHTQAYQIS